MIATPQNLLKLIEDRISREETDATPEELYDPINYIMKLGGKRVRPVMALLAYSMYEENPNEIIDQALSIEVFHNFTLVHDDIMDNAPLRRGKETIHVKWNPNIAILSGDVMLVNVYQMLMKGLDGEKLKGILELFNNTAVKVCEGQQLDMNFENDMNVSEEDYIKMIRFKTAELLGYSLALGAMLAEQPEDADILYQIGIKAGIGFQLKDDLLDVWGDESFGKKIGGDIVANKKTYLTIKTMQLADSNDLEILKKWFSEKNGNEKEKINKVKGMYEKYEIREQSEKLIDSYFSEAFHLLKKLDAPLHKRKTLKQFLEYLINRTT